MPSVAALRKASAPRAAPSPAPNVGKEAPRGTLSALQQENLELKRARNTQEQALKELNTQFQRLCRDAKRQPGGVVQSEGRAARLEHELEVRTRQRDGLQRELDRYKAYLTARYGRLPSLSPPRSRDVPSRPLTARPRLLKAFGSDRTRGAPHDDADALRDALGLPVVGRGSGPQVAVSESVAIHATGAPPAASIHAAPAAPDTSALGLAPAAPSPQRTPEVEALQQHLAEAREHAAREESRAASLQKERAVLTSQLAAAQGRSGAGATLAAALTAAQDELRGAQERLAGSAARASTLQQDNDDLRSQLHAAVAQTAANAEALRAAVSARVAAEQARAAGQAQERVRIAEQLQQAGAQLEAVAAERDRLAAAAARPAAASTEGDAPLVHAVQHQVSEQGARMAVLQQRFEAAQGHVSTLTAQCERLVDELRVAHAETAAERQKHFQTSHEKAQLEVAAARASEVDIALSHKTEELARTEAELLRTVDRLSRCASETEANVRLECRGRLAEVEAALEEAGKQRRQAERDLFAARQRADEKQRDAETARSDAAHFREEMERVAGEKSEVASRLAQHLQSAPLDTKTASEMISSAVAPLRGGGGAADAALQALDGGAQWDASWEATQLRELLTTTQLDQQLADARARELETALEGKAALMERLGAERDELLDENVDLRRRLTGVQTAFAHRDAALVAAHADNSAALEVRLVDVSCSAEALRQEADGDGEAVHATLFATLEGLAGFDLAGSDEFPLCTHDAAAVPVDATFRFAGLSVSAAEAAALRASSLTLQLHRVVGLTSTVVAAATVAGSCFARCADGVASLAVPLLDGEATTVGAARLSVSISDLALATLVARPVRAPHGGPSASLDVASMRAALLSFRGVRALRIRVVRCASLAAPGGVEPRPYVFYSASSACGRLLVADTVVQTDGRRVTADPTFGVDPVEHAVVPVDADCLDFVASGSVGFIVFDHASRDPEANIGAATVPLAPLLQSPQATIAQEYPLHPQGTLEVELSWVR